MKKEKLQSKVNKKYWSCDVPSEAKQLHNKNKRNTRVHWFSTVNTAAPQNFSEFSYLLLNNPYSNTENRRSKFDNELKIRQIIISFIVIFSIFHSFLFFLPFADVKLSMIAQIVHKNAYLGVSYVHVCIRTCCTYMFATLQPHASFPPARV